MWRRVSSGESRLVCKFSQCSGIVTISPALPDILDTWMIEGLKLFKEARVRGFLSVGVDDFHLYDAKEIKQ